MCDFSSLPRNSWKTRLFFPLLGILTALVLLEIILRLAGGVRALKNERPHNLAANTSSVVTILCLGESTTFMGEQNSYIEKR